MKKLIVLLVFVAAGYKLYDMNFSETEALPFYVESEKFSYSASFPKKPEYKYKEVDHPDFGPIGIEVYGVNSKKSSYIVQATKYLDDNFVPPESLEDLNDAFSDGMIETHDLVNENRINISGVPATRFVFVEKDGLRKITSIVMIKDNLGVLLMAIPKEGDELIAEEFLESFDFNNKGA